MSYWSEVKEVALKGIDLAIANIKEGAGIAIEKGKDSVVYVQLKKDLFVEQRNLHNLLADLGDITNELYKSKADIAGNDRVREAIDKISSTEAKCKSIEAEIGKLSAK